MVATNLPLQRTSFIGRERDLAEVERLLFGTRLVTLTGAGGCGKTRLAIQVANHVSEKFKDGVWLVDLAPLREPGLVSQLTAQALGMPPAVEQPIQDALFNWVRFKRLLLVLDNCDHLIDACAQLAGQLLAQASEVHLIATSGEPLAVAGEMIYPLHGLPIPPLGGEIVRSRPVEQQSVHTLQEIMDYDAVRLFVERARAISPDFTLTSENAIAVTETCQRLDGLPLALELASARVNVLTVQEIAARLNDRFALLTSGQRTGHEPRHHTLRAAIDWNYSLLLPNEQILLRRLAVFVAGWTLETAEYVCSGDEIAQEEILDLLSSLVDKSFIVAETTGRAQAHYRLLETIREYALEKLNQSGEANRLFDCLLDLYLARAEETEPKLNDVNQQLWLNWLESEHDNLRVALAWALEAGFIEKGLRIAIAIQRFWEIRGYVQEGLAWFKRLLDRADERVSTIVRAKAYSYASFLAMFLGDIPTTQAYGREAVALAETAGEEGRGTLFLALGGLASGARVAGDYLTAFNLGERLIQLQRELPGQPFVLGMALLAQGGVAIELGFYDTARVALEESLALARQAGDSFRIAHALNSTGDLARCEHKYDDSQTAYEDSIALLRAVGAQRDLASVLNNLGHTCLHLGNIERAQALFCESMAAHQALQNAPGMAECLIGFAAIALLRGLPAVGACLLRASCVMEGQQTVIASMRQVTRMEYEHYLELARTTLAEADFQAEQKRGAAMSLEEAVNYAQNLLLKPRIVSAPAPLRAEIPDGLTVREREVAALIGQGKTNSEIATELVLSKRTVETHVSNILSKLGLTSRSQVMRWAIDRGLR